MKVLSESGGIFTFILPMNFGDSGTVATGMILEYSFLSKELWRKEARVMETLKMIVVISLKLLGMTFVFLATVYSPDTAVTYFKATAVAALPFFVNFFSEIAKNIAGTLRYAGTVNLAIAFAVVLTLLVGLISLAEKKIRGHI
jgi:hypothetical protein